ncbi:capping complex subunit for YIEGIA [Neobacillus cucumis]|uniref:capping complex subunit for YIEGIA n=1 Tax=Neobacillus cucumis TaxID=1740721 RepID=UPI001FDBBD03|nr:hypothetical protein [Neobacillus cucumis]MBM7653366.1 hypothetical protein [Neobacillus cucumis]MED4224628.1 hypothetical protein [Neobacillus cucumis]
MNYDVLALVTLNKDRILGGKQLTLLAGNEEEQKIMTADIAKALQADVVKMTSGDYLVIRG